MIPRPSHLNSHVSYWNLCHLQMFKQFLQSCEEIQFTVFWDITPYTLINRFQHSGEMYCLCLRGSLMMVYSIWLLICSQHFSHSAKLHYQWCFLKCFSCWASKILSFLKGGRTKSSFPFDRSSHWTPLSLIWIHFTHSYTLSMRFISMLFCCSCLGF
jgi:hypothetical protein